MDMSELHPNGILELAWEKFKQNWGKLIGIVLTVAILSLVAIFMFSIISEDSFLANNLIANILFLIIFIIAILIINMSWINILIKIGRGEDFKILEIFGTIRPILYFAAVNLLYTLIVMGGLILLVIPGMIWGIKFSLASYFVVDQGLGPIEALKASGRVTQGSKWDILGLRLVFGLVGMLGYVALIIGVIPAMLVIAIGNALMYLYLVEEEKINTEKKAIQE